MPAAPQWSGDIAGNTYNSNPARSFAAVFPALRMIVSWCHVRLGVSDRGPVASRQVVEFLVEGEQAVREPVGGFHRGVVADAVEGEGADVLGDLAQGRRGELSGSAAYGEYRRGEFPGCQSADFAAFAEHRSIQSGCSIERVGSRVGDRKST